MSKVSAVNSLLTKVKIYVFLNGLMGDTAQRAAVSEEGYCMASLMVPKDLQGFAKSALMKNLEFIKEYEKYYPNGYELVYIDDINAARYSKLLQFIQRTTAERVREHRGIEPKYG